MQSSVRQLIFLVILVFLCRQGFSAQEIAREIDLGITRAVGVSNNYGRVSVAAGPDNDIEGTPIKGSLSVRSDRPLLESEIVISLNGGRAMIVIRPINTKMRVDLILRLPERSLIKIATIDGAVDVTGNFADIEIATGTGTIATDVPLDDLRYKLQWTESRPRFMADIDLENVREKSAGRFEIKGRFAESKGKEPMPDSKVANDESANSKKIERSVSLDLRTARGIILINVPPNEVGSDLRERPLTDAAKAIVRSGDSLLMEAIRRAAPKYYGDYAKSLPPIKREPRFAAKTNGPDIPAGPVKQALVRVTDLNNRAVADLKAGDFEVLENGSNRQILDVEPSTAPFNLVLLVDVSGSVENYVNFIRKAARSFVDTVDRRDRVSIIMFNDDVKVLSKFTTDKSALSESLDTFDAGGGTAYYDALAYTVSDTLRPLRGERTAIVILTDGDDNRSFLAFDSLLGSIQESGALIYPLYVPSGLIAAESQSGITDIDPLRKRYMTLSAKSEGEGERLARISGGVYYPIKQISEIQKAYKDIVVQLRTAYLVTFRSDETIGVSPKLKIKVNRESAFTTINSVIAEGNN